MWAHVLFGLEVAPKGSGENASPSVGCIPMTSDDRNDILRFKALVYMSTHYETRRTAGWALQCEH